MDPYQVLQKITKFYLNSKEFNGIPINELTSETKEIIPVLKQLLLDNKITCNFGDKHSNPHILALHPEPKEEQILKLNKSKFFCIYPSKEHLKLVVKPNDYKDKPYTLSMALGNPQLIYKSFNLTILEQYRNDPRFSYDVDDIQGSISAKSNTGLKKQDDILIETFSFAYDKKIKHRYVAVYLIYISRLSAEHQQRWQLEEFNGETFLHPEYEKSTAGHFPDKESIFNAFCEEINIINQMSTQIDKNVTLFRNSYSRYNKPKDFGFLIRPTKKEYENFIHLLDKMMSENLNKEFFKNKIDLYDNEKRPKGTISLLDEWLDKVVNFPDPTPKNEMINTFKKIRKKRQPQAHHIREDEWDNEIFSKQRDIIIKAYSSVRTLRLILSNHPSTKNVDIPEWLYNGDICYY